jgi:hypothetical protein
MPGTRFVTSSPVRLSSATHAMVGIEEGRAFGRGVAGGGGLLCWRTGMVSSLVRFRRAGRLGGSAARE